MTDKLKHFIAGYILGAISYISGFWWSGLLISSLIFFGKEIFDIYKPHPTMFDKADLLADYAGFGVGFGTVGFIHGIFNLLK